MMPTDLRAALQRQVHAGPKAAALLAVDREPLSRGGLLETVDSCGSFLRSRGIGRKQRVALVLPQGPEAAAAFVALAAACGCAPLNPGYRERELDFYLDDLGAAALVTLPDQAPAARSVAQRRGIPIFDLLPGAAAGAFSLRGETGRAPSVEPAAGADDVALLLHTSGTTSRPKLVPLLQRNLCASAWAIAETLRLQPSDRCLELMPLFHIHGLMGSLLSSLLAGASVVCTPGFFAPRVFAWLERFAPSWTSAVPTMYQALLARAEEHKETIARRPMRVLRSSSASMPPSVMAELERVFGAPVVESYGMTEACHQMCSNPLPPLVRKPGAVGLPAGPEVRVLTADGRPAAVGEVGEVVIRGPGVTAGYVANPDANREAFTDGGWFRTGDEGRFDAGGYLFLTGRLKEIINRGGEKISPREIDERLLEHPAVAQAVCFALPDARLGEDVGAAIVLQPGARVEAAELRRHCSEQLASFKLPRRFVFVAAIPKGPTGKLRRIGLAGMLGIEEEAAPVAERAPVGALEEGVAAIWCEVLEREQVSASQEFLAAGGDSMLAGLVVTRIRERFGLELDLLALYEASTVEAQAQLLAAAPARIEPDCALGRRVGGGVAPLSAAQRRQWILARLEPDSPLAQRPLLLRLRGPLEVERLESALSALVERHEALRSRFPEQAPGSPCQEVLADWRPNLRLEDLRTLPADEREDALETYALAACQEVFAVTQEPPLRAWVLQLDAEDACLFLLFHHIIFDGWSEALLVRELSALYIGETLPSLPIQVADHAVWQAGQPAPALDWWQQQLVGLQILELPLDRPRPEHPTIHAGRYVRVLPSELVAELSQLGQSSGATLFMVLLAGFQTLLSRSSGQTDIVVGTPVSGRVRSDTEGLIGCFMNLLVLRTDLAGSPGFGELLGRTRATTLGALAHQTVPFERLVEVLRPTRTANRWPLFQVMFQLRNHPRVQRCQAGELALEVQAFDAGIIGGLDLSLDCEPGPKGLACKFDYAAELFEPASIERLAERFEALLRAALEDRERAVDRLPWLDEGERARLLALGCGAPLQVPPLLLQEGFEAWALRTPEAPAVRGPEGSLSYAQLQRRAEALAASLLACGAGRGSVVGIRARPSLRFPVAVLAVLKAGAAWLPLDASIPPSRVVRLLRQAEATLVVGDAELLAALPAAVGTCLDLAEVGQQSATEMAPCTALPGDLAYMIPTSGSTGDPKCVAVPHRAIVHHLAWRRQFMGIERSDRVLLAASISFDDAVWEMFDPLNAGGCLVLPPLTGPADMRSFARCIDEQKVTATCLVPSLLRVFLEALEPGECKGLRRMTTGGEVLPVQVVKRFFELLPETRLLSGYGPAEACVAVSFWECRPEQNLPRVPIGRPIDGVRIYVLDQSGQPSPQGVTGELWLGGPTLANGYLGQAELTAECFLPDPFAPGERMYRSGDFGRFLPDGNLEFLGRRDGQVKLHGVRVELAEVETALAAHPAVREAAARVDAGRLLAWVVPAGSEPVADELRRFLRERLPEAFVPAAIGFLAELPHTSSGKLDRRALPAPGPTLAVARPFLAPAGPMQQRLAGLWCKLLELPRVSADANFFDLGGHSLLAIELVARLEKELGIALSARQLTHQTLAQLAGVCEQRVAARPQGLGDRLLRGLRRVLRGE